jgi:hypothetical protein
VDEKLLCAATPQDQVKSNSLEAVFLFSRLIRRLSVLQGWIFGVNYFVSATNCSFNVGWLTENKIRAIGWIVGVLYFVYLTVVLVYGLSTFPRYDYIGTY